MFATIVPISSLLAGVALLLLGSGLFGTLLAVRGGLEGFPDIVLGLIMSSYFVGFLIGTWLGPQVIRRVGHIRTFAICAAVAACTGLLHPMWVDPWFWALLRVLTGISLVGLYTVIESWLNTHAASEQRGRVFASYMVVNLAALAISQWLILLAPPSGFMLFSLVAIFISLSLIPIAMTRLDQPQTSSHASLNVRQLYRVAPVGVVGSLVSGLAMGAFWGLAPVFAQRIGLELIGISTLMSLVILGGAALQYPIGRYSDRHDRRRVLGKVTAAAAIVAVATLLLLQIWRDSLYPLMFLYGGLAFSLYPICVAHMVDHLAPEEVLAGSSGLLLLHGIGAAVGPTLAGVVMGLIGSQALLLYFALVLAPLALFAARHATPAADDDVIAEDQTGVFVPMVRTSPIALELLPDGDAAPQVPEESEAPWEEHRRPPGSPPQSPTGLP
jgi:MFS family permease